MERTIDVGAMLARIEILEGQARLLSAMLVSTIAAVPDKAKVAEVMALTWSDLQVQLRPDSTLQGDARAERRNRWNGANTAWNQLQTDLAEHAGK